MYQTYQPQKDQSGKTISIVHLSPQYRNNGGGPTNVMFAFRQSADLMTGRSSQSNMSSMSGTLPGYLLRSCRIPHIVNTSLVCIDFLYFSIQALPLTITRPKMCATLRFLHHIPCDSFVFPWPQILVDPPEIVRAYRYRRWVEIIIGVEGFRIVCWTGLCLVSDGTVKWEFNYSFGGYLMLCWDCYSQVC